MWDLGMGGGFGFRDVLFNSGGFREEAAFLESAWLHKLDGRIG